MCKHLSAWRVFPRRSSFKKIMRVPISITLPACILVAVFVFWLGSQDKEFMEPPTPERLVEISDEWEKSRPNIPSPKPINAALLADPTPITPQSPPQVENKKPDSLPPGDFELAPSLTEYGTYGDKGAEAMIQLATLLETKAQYQRALLAWERVIDTSNPNTQERKLATQAIQRLRNNLPPWNPDPTADITLTLHAGATFKEKEPLTSVLKSAAETITVASGHTVKVDTKISFGKSSEIKTPRIPVAIWFSYSASSVDGVRAETSPISFMVDPQQPQTLKDQVSYGIYALLRTQLTTKTNFSALPELPSVLQADDLLHYHITRLMWREFALSIQE